MNDNVDELIKALEEMTADRDKQLANYHFMVKKAFDKNMPAYREQSQNMMAVEDRVQERKLVLDRVANKGLAYARKNKVSDYMIDTFKQLVDEIEKL